MLRQSRLHPALSAQAMIHGPHDFLKTPLGPPGCKVLIHEKPTVRGTWAPHAVDGWYLGPSYEHYRSHRTWICDTGRERITDTLAWFPTHVRMPDFVLQPTEATPTTTTLEPPSAIKDTSVLLPPPTVAQPKTKRSKLPTITEEPDDSDEPTAITPATIITQDDDATIPQCIDSTTLPTVHGADTPYTQQQIVKRPSPAPLPRVPAEHNTAVSHSPLALPFPTSTYHHMTRNAGQRRRQQAATKKAAATNTDQAIVVSPSPSSTTPLPPAPITHSHGTRSKSKALAIDAEQWTTVTSKHTRSRTRKHKKSERAQAKANALAALPTLCIVWTANAVIDPSTGAMLEYAQLRKGEDADIWLRSFGNEIGRLAQGYAPYTKSGSDTLFFIAHSDKPADRKATYMRVVASIRMNKEETHRVRCTVGGDKVDYPGKVSTPTAELTTVKIHLNSVISTPGARYATLNVKDFYLGTPIQRYEYMRIPVHLIPPDLMLQYNLEPLIHNGHVMIEIRKGMYGLPQAGLLAQLQLIDHLSKFGYNPVEHTPGLW
jgi:hypothetical protein